MRKFLFLLLGLSLSAQAQTIVPNEPLMPTVSTVNASDQEHFQLLIRGMNQFAFDLFQLLSRQPGNFCISPFSIAASLTMAGVGARQETSTQIQQLLHYPAALNLLVGDLNLLLLSPSNGPKNTAQLLSANAIWIQKNIPLLISFQQIIQRDFQIKVGIVNFKEEVAKTLRLINEWGAKQTKNKINQIVNAQDVSQQTQLLLTAAIYLQGQWAQPFNPSLTQRELFYVTPHYSVMAPMMHQTGEFLYQKGEKWESVTVPYLAGEKGAQFMLTCLVPLNASDLKSLENDLNEANWLMWQKREKMTPLTFTLPRFRLENRFNLETLLKNRGVGQIFTPQADFSGISTDHKLFIDAATHKVIFKIDEKGSDVLTLANPRVSLEQNLNPLSGAQTIQLNHPFVFIIWDQTSRTIIFIGRLNQP